MKQCKYCGENNIDKLYKFNYRGTGKTAVCNLCYKCRSVQAKKAQKILIKKQGHANFKGCKHSVETKKEDFRKC